MTDLHHRVDGPDGAPALVLSNSLGTDMSLWEPQLPALTKRFRVVRYDTRGHGRSPVPDRELTIADLGADLLGMLDHVGVERVSLAGVSLGGMASMWAASEAPERVERLVLCCTSARLGPPEMWQERIDTVRADGLGALADATMKRWFTPAADPAVVARFHAMISGMPAAGYAACCAAIRDMDLRERLPRIAAPTLVIGATDDTSAPPAEHAEIIAAGIPGARLLVLDRAAHLANVERADAVTAVMEEHLAGEARR
jgi:3-oxoadipate enol-lactonase